MQVYTISKNTMLFVLEPDCEKLWIRNGKLESNERTFFSNINEWCQKAIENHFIFGQRRNKIQIVLCRFTVQREHILWFSIAIIWIQFLDLIFILKSFISFAHKFPFIIHRSWWFLLFVFFNKYILLKKKINKATATFITTTTTTPGWIQFRFRFCLKLIIIFFF